MGKTVLNLEPDYSFGLIGISCHLRDYRLCWSLNRQLEMNFRRENDYEIPEAKKPKSKIAFSCFRYDDEVQMKTYFLFSNRSEGGYLLPEMKQADFLLMVQGNISKSEMKELRSAVGAAEPVLAAFEIEVTTLRSRQNLIF